MLQKEYTKDIQVRLKSNPGKIGITTGNFKNIDDLRLVQIKFSSSEITYKPISEIEEVEQILNIQDLLKNPNFGRVRDLKNIITHQKIKGNLTNIFYKLN